MQIRTQDARFFRSDDGETFVYGDDWGRSLLYSPDGSTFYKLHVTGFAGNNKENELSFENPHHNKHGRIKRMKNELDLNGKEYHKIEGPNQIEVVPLPTVRQPEYLFELPDGQYLYVSADKYAYSYESFRLYVGSPDAMRQIPVQNVRRARDGGTTFVTTTEGELFSPTPFDTEAKASWKKDVELKKVNQNLFRIVEDDTAHLFII